MLTLLFLLVLMILLYFIVRKVIRQKMIIEKLKSDLNACQVQVKKNKKSSKS
ncbi:hypothetical protein MHK_001743 [Candidatus Magnetomorum sp. HK-1]|nr:hypothetical protein MHK_001743 [Candidatus Magnetomorum sp. HK-1]